jgi:hypothetical protein
MPVEPDHV